MEGTSRQARHVRVTDVMTPVPVTLTEHQSVHHAGVILLRQGVSAAPVVDDDGGLVGVFSHSDVLARFASPRHRRGPLARVDDRHARAVTVGQACSRPAITVGAGTTVDTAARELLDRDVGRLIVVDEGALIGVVSRTDVLKLFLPEWAEQADDPDPRPQVGPG
jgi:CBS domain-containing protein